MKKALNLKDKNFRKKVIATLITILSIIAVRVDCPYLDGIIIIVASYFEFIQQDIKGFVARHKKAAN